jgi:hypothetical protein
MYAPLQRSQQAGLTVVSYLTRRGVRLLPRAYLPRHVQFRLPDLAARGARGSGCSRCPTTRLAADRAAAWGNHCCGCCMANAAFWCTSPGAVLCGCRPQHASAMLGVPGASSDWRAQQLRPLPRRPIALCVSQGSALQRVAAFFVGGAPRLRMEEVVHSPGDRFRLQTVAGGMVHLRLGGGPRCLGSPPHVLPGAGC